MTDLFPADTTAVHKEEPQLQHRWLYSVVPARAAEYINDTIEPEEIRYRPLSEIGIYLAGFCGDCRRAFSVPIPFGTAYEEVQLDVPKFGCVGPFAGL